MKFYTYNNATIARDELNNYINLIENYKEIDLNTWVVKNYVITGSINGVIKRLDNCPFPYETLNHSNNRKIIKNILLGPPKDELHKMIKSHYISKYIRKKSQL